MASQEEVRRSHISVSRKFVPTDTLQAQLEGRYGEYERLRRLQGDQRAQQPTGALSFFRLPDKEIRDEYVDFEGRLSGQDVHVRYRSFRMIPTISFPIVNESSITSEWQAKLRMGGDSTTSSMLEISGRGNCKFVASLYLPGLDLKRVTSVADLRTERKTYVVQKPFGWHKELNAEGEIRVLLDEVTASGVSKGEIAQGEASFRHHVGQVKLTSEVVGGESDREHDALRGQEMARMQTRLTEFVKGREAVFPTREIKSKLEAYHAWTAERGGDSSTKC